MLNHPKTLALCEASKLDKDVVIGRLHRLWWWCLDYAFDGDLRKFDKISIELACGLPLLTLQSSGFIDIRPYRRIHGWWHYAGNYLKVKYKNQPEKWHQIEKSYYTTPNTYPNTTPKGMSKDVYVEDVEREEKKEDVKTYTDSTTFASLIGQHRETATVNSILTPGLKTKSIDAPHDKRCTCQECWK